MDPNVFPTRRISILKQDTLFKFQRWRTLRNNINRIIEMNEEFSLDEGECQLVNKVLHLAETGQDHLITDMVFEIHTRWIKRKYRT